MTETSSTPRKRKRTNPLVLLLVAVIPVAIVGWVLYLIQVRKPTQANTDRNADLVTSMLGLNDATKLRLDPKFTDADADLVADPPADPKQIIDPPTLTFSFVGTREPEAYQRDFKEFVDHLSSKVGRPVQYVLFRTPQDELRAMCDGKLHIAGFNTGAVPHAVNQCGFVPVANFASAEGTNFYQMELIVPADSSLQKLDDVRGHEVTLTEPGSNSGFKAPLVLLKDNRLLPGKDFSVRYSRGHEESIAGIASKTYQVAAVASDILAREVAAGKIRNDQFRVIYKSENFPTAGIGYVYNLKPDLAVKIRDAIFSFQWKGTGVEREFAMSNQSQFKAVNFKNDWALVRRIDDAIRSVEQLPPMEEEESTTQPTMGANATSGTSAISTTAPAAVSKP